VANLSGIKQVREVRREHVDGNKAGDVGMRLCSRSMTKANEETTKRDGEWKGGRVGWARGGGKGKRSGDQDERGKK